MNTVIKTEESQPNWSALLESLEQTKKDLDLVLKIVRNLIGDAPLDAYSMLVRDRDIATSLLSGCSDIQSHLTHVNFYGIVSQLAEFKRIHYRDHLEVALKSRNLAHTSRWPTYVVADVVRLEIKLEKFEAVIDGKKAASIEPEVIAQLLAERVSSLVRPDFNLSLFRSHLLCAFEELRKGVSTPGSYINIRDLYSAVKPKYDRDKYPYSEAHFGVDLFRLLTHEQTAGVEMSLELSPAQDARGGLFVPGRDGGNYIAALRFK